MSGSSTPGPGTEQSTSWSPHATSAASAIPETVSSSEPSEHPEQPEHPEHKATSATAAATRVIAGPPEDMPPMPCPAL